MAQARALTRDLRQEYSRLEIITVILAALLGVALLWALRYRGWYAHDEGTLGQSAERILAGQVPHRDFDDPYSGGLGLLHALVFRIGSVSMNALRDHLAFVATAWFGGIFWLLTRWLRPIGTAVVAATIVAFSVPLYPAAMPSWYVLFLACAAGGVLVISREHIYRAAAFAGMLIGIAALAKITAVFALAGAGWAIVAMRQQDHSERRGSIEVVLAAPLFAVMVLHLIRPLIDGPYFVHVALPSLAIVAGIAWHELRYGRSHGFGIDVELWRRILALVVGAAIPVALFAVWLSTNGALAPFIASLRGVVGARAAAASMEPAGLVTLACALPLVAILAGVGSRWRFTPLVTGGVAIALIAVAWFVPAVHIAVWSALFGLIPLAALLFAGRWSRIAATEPSTAHRAIAVFAPLAGVMALTQFPFAPPIYFLYFLPLALLAISAAVAAQAETVRKTAGIATLLYLVFGLVEVVPGAPDSLAEFADHAPDLSWLTTHRGRLLIPSDFADLYQRLLATMDSIPPGPIWAGPDAPEVAFLSGRRDLNRSFFAMLGGDNPPGPLLAAHMASLGARAIVVDQEPSFSNTLGTSALDSISRYFPEMRTVDRFQIHWRTGAR